MCVFVYKINHSPFSVGLALIKYLLIYLTNLKVKDQIGNNDNLLDIVESVRTDTVNSHTAEIWHLLSIF